MTPNRITRLVLIVACLAFAGCAEIDRRVGGVIYDRIVPAKADEEHAELERELSMYSD